MNIKVGISALALIVSAIGIAAIAPQSAEAASHKVNICHANNGNGTGGYNSNNVDASSVDGQGGNGDHNRSGHQDGRDIIPPFYDDGTPGYWTPRNWNAVGMATFYNRCNTPKVATASISKTPATCSTAEKLVYGNITNATFSGTANGTVGPAPYNVTATANRDALFSGNTTSQVFNGALSGVIPAQNTNPNAPCYQQPELLVATASVTTEPATCSAPEKLVWGSIEHASFSGTPDGTTGPGNYSVTATANSGAAFAGNTPTKSFNNSLAGPIGYQSTDPEGACYQRPELLVATASVTTDKATCSAAEKLVYGDIANAVFGEGSTPNGTTGPGSYDVTAIANLGAQFAGGSTSQSFAGALADKTPMQHTNPEAPCYFTPGKGAGETPKPTVEPTPVVAPAPQIAELPNTSGTSTPVLVAGAALVASFAIALTSIIKFSITSRL